MNADQADLRGFLRIPAEGRKADQRRCGQNIVLYVFSVLAGSARNASQVIWNADERGSGGFTRIFADSGQGPEGGSTPLRTKRRMCLAFRRHFFAASLQGKIRAVHCSWRHSHTFFS
jgi:hypothetical protein